MTEKRIPIQLDKTYDSLVLCCPNCGDGYLHQDKYRISNPESYGSKSVVVDSDLMHSDSTGFDLNDTRPRESIEIKFWCECCSADNLKLQIIQHKGNTFIHWGVQ